MLRAHARRDQPLAETLRLTDGIECMKFRRALHAKECRGAADRDDQRVVFERARGKEFGAVVVEHGAECEALARPIQPGQIALLKLEAMPARLRRIFEFLRERVHAACRDLMQQRLPDMRRIAVDQRDLRTHAASDLCGA